MLMPLSRKKSRSEHSGSCAFRKQIRIWEGKKVVISALLTNALIMMHQMERSDLPNRTTTCGCQRICRGGGEGGGNKS
jgi:hypothetical protein